MNEETSGQEGLPEVSPVESEAREQGWVPKDDFKGDEHKWVDAGEFIRRGELFAKIESQNKKLKSMEDTMSQFKQHHDKVQENAYKKALADLRAAKKEALVEGDADKVIAVDEQIEEVRTEAAQARAQAQRQPVAQEEHPEFVAFKTKNSWYENNKAMRAWADARGEELVRGGKAPSEVLNLVAKEAREEFPQRFENPNRSKPGAVEASTNRGVRGERGESFNPSEVEKNLARKFVRDGLFKNEAEYYKELSNLKS